MAYCANCGHQISDLAVTCPSCGHATGVAPPRTPYAHFWRRVGASLLDGLILAIAGLFLGSGRSFGGVVVGFLYNWLMIAFNDGRTLGKMALNIRIARPDGSAVDLGTAAARAGMALVSGLAFGIGYLWAAFDSENRTWHDMVADTRAFDIR
jgi:uncharacterized RDD family membrane protein YckC